MAKTAIRIIVTAPPYAPFLAEVAARTPPPAPQQVQFSSRVTRVSVAAEFRHAMPPPL